MKDINIYVFGDSITYGAGDYELGGWVNRLRLILENDGSEIYYNVFNLGISGEETRETSERFESELRVRYDMYVDNIIIFAIGINDTLDVCGKDEVPLEDFKNNITNLINKAKKYSNKILFIGLTKVNENLVAPLPWNLEKSYFNEKIIKYDNEIEKICLENNIYYLKIFDLLTNDYLIDGLHPNEIGHQKMCDKVLEKIREFIEIQ